MRKILPFLVVFLLIFSGCNKNVNVEDVLADVQMHYNLLENFNCSFNAVTSLNDKAQEFGISMEYNAKGNDIITIIEPFEVSGVTASISKVDDSLILSFDDFQVETLMAENLGISPVDVTSFAIFDVKNRDAYAISVTDCIKLSYQNEEILKDVYLNLQTYDIMKIEVYISGEMVINCDYF